MDALNTAVNFVCTQEGFEPNSYKDSGGVYLNSAANGQSYITDNTFDSIGFNGELFQGVCIAAGG